MNKELTQKHLRFLAFRHFGSWYILAVLCWIVTIVVYFKQPAANRETPMTCLITAIAATAICLVYGTYRVRQAIYLFRNGVEVQGIVSGFGVLRTYGLIRVNCSYQVDGRAYVTAWSGPADQYDLDDKVALIADPRRPQVCERKSNIYPDYREPSVDKPDSWKWWYYVLAGIGFGAFTVYGYLNPGFLKPGPGAHGAFVDLYNLAGAWGIMALTSILSLALIWIGVLEFKKQSR